MANLRSRQSRFVPCSRPPEQEKLTTFLRIASLLMSPPRLLLPTVSVCREIPRRPIDGLGDLARLASRSRLRPHLDQGSTHTRRPDAADRHCQDCAPSSTAAVAEGSGRMGTATLNPVGDDPPASPGFRPNHNRTHTYSSTTTASPATTAVATQLTLEAALYQRRAVAGRACPAGRAPAQDPARG